MWLCHYFFKQCPVDLAWSCFFKQADCPMLGHRLGSRWGIYELGLHTWQDSRGWLRGLCTRQTFTESVFSLTTYLVIHPFNKHSLNGCSALTRAGATEVSPPGSQPSDRWSEPLQNSEAWGGAVSGTPQAPPHGYLWSFLPVPLGTATWLQGPAGMGAQDTRGLPYWWLGFQAWPQPELQALPSWRQWFLRLWGGPRPK